MPNPITITVENMPGPLGIDPRAYQEIVARIVYATTYFGDPELITDPTNYPREIKVFVDDDSGEYEDSATLQHRWIPANGTGMYNSWPAPTPEDPHARGTDARWFQVQASWDGEGSSVICRDFDGTLQHWM